MDSPRKLNINNPAVPGKSSPPIAQNANQGIATLIVMVAVLVIIVLFCCFAAPGIRGLCKRYIFRTCDIDDPDIDNASRITEEASPTVILLPNGRMLVVDRRILMRSDFDLSDDRVRPFRGALGSTPSILDSSETSKGVSPTSLGYPPPNYDDVFPRLLDLPPSYSEISLMAKNFAAMDRSLETVDLAAASGSLEAVAAVVPDGSHVAVSGGSLPASEGGCEAIEMAYLDRSSRESRVASEGECAVETNSDRCTVIVVENSCGDIDNDNNDDVDDNVNRTNYDI